MRVNVSGRDETMQPAKPSFLQYFEQKEKEANSHREGGGDPADHRGPPEGDLQVVSNTHTQLYMRPVHQKVLEDQTFVYVLIKE